MSNQDASQQNNAPAKANLSVVATLKARVFCCTSKDVTIYADRSNAPAVIEATAQIVEKHGENDPKTTPLTPIEEEQENQEK